MSEREQFEATMKDMFPRAILEEIRPEFTHDFWRLWQRVRALPSGTIGHLNEPEPALQHEPGVVDPELVRQALQQVQHRDGFGRGKVVPVWCQLIAAARYAIEDLQASQRQWIPVSERLPDHVGAYLVAGFAVIAWAFYSSDKVFRSAMGEVPFEITHWMPLPTLPVAKAVQS